MEEFLLKNKKEIMIYTKLYLKSSQFQIFYKLLPNSTLNKREYEIYFLIIIKENFPEKPPTLTCLTDVKLNYNLNIIIYSFVIHLYVIIVIYKN